MTLFPIVYGERGVLASDGERVQCHLCGRWLGHLGGHVKRAHGMEAEDYKREFGLMQATGLIGPALAAKRREMIAPLREAAAPRLNAIRSGRLSIRFDNTGRKASLEELRRKRDAPRRHIRRRVLGYSCGVCGTYVPTAKYPTRKTCSDECLREAKRRNGIRVRNRQLGRAT